MADDPTTTGEKQPEPTQTGGTLDTEGIARALRHFPGGAVTERSPFTFNWECELVYKVADRELTIELEIKDRHGQIEMRTEVFKAPLSTFGSPTELNMFLADVKRNYFDTLREQLAREATSLLVDACRALCHMLGFGVEDRARIIKDHTDETARALEVLLAALPEKQRGESGWAKVALRSAVWVATVRLIQRGVTGRALTLDAVNDELRTLYPTQTPQSGEALRKQLDERGLSWRTLKAEAERLALTPVPPPPSSSENGGEPVR
jgi:hypothetical protein